MHISVQIEQNSIDEFIDHWSGKYHYAHEHKYDTNIAKDLTQDKDALMKMFKWKNGRKLSPAKRKGVREKIEWLETVQSRERSRICEAAESKYLHEKSGGAIWNIFFLHCLDPKKWPIYDQHAYRAMIYLEAGRVCENERNDSEKYRNYTEKYIPFLKQPEFLNFELRKADKALFTFGKFLKTYKSYA